MLGRIVGLMKKVTKYIESGVQKGVSFKNYEKVRR